MPKRLNFSLQSDESDSLLATLLNKEQDVISCANRHQPSLFEDNEEKIEVEVEEV
jgi:hypothetical protein